MTAVTTTLRFAHRGEEIKRLCRKNDKENLARIIAQVHELLRDDALTPHGKLQEMEKLIIRTYW